MSNKVYDILKRVDSDRQQLVKKAQLKGFPLKDNSDFNQIMNTIGVENENKLLIPSSINLDSDWVRPSEFPDTEAILENAEIINGYYPATLILLNDSKGDTLNIPKFESSINLSSKISDSNMHHSCRGFLTSDGTWLDCYSNAVTHNWDTSKDIIVNDGEFAGRYRWIIGYISTNAMNSFIGDLPAVEIIVGCSKCPYAEPFFSYNNINNETLLNYIVTSNISSGIIVGASNNSGNNFLSSFYQLRNIEFRKEFTISNRGAKIFYYLYRLRKLDLSKVSITPSYENPQLLSCSYNLIEYKDILKNNSTQYSVNLNLQTSPKIQKLDVNISKIQLVKDNWDGAYLNVTQPISSIPNTWEELKAPCIYSTNNSYSKLKILDFNMLSGIQNIYEVTYNSTSPLKFSRDYFPYLEKMIFTNDWNYKFDISEVPFIDRETLLDLIEKLKDLNGMTVYSPNIILGSINLKKLTEDEIAIATNKGWTVS